MLSRYSRHFLPWLRGESYAGTLTPVENHNVLEYVFTVGPGFCKSNTWSFVGDRDRKDRWQFGKHSDCQNVKWQLHPTWPWDSPSSSLMPSLVSYWQHTKQRRDFVHPQNPLVLLNWRFLDAVLMFFPCAALRGTSYTYGLTVLAQDHSVTYFHNLLIQCFVIQLHVFSV